MLRAWSVLSIPVSAERPSSRRILAISSAATPLEERAFTKAFFTASTSSWERGVALEPWKWTWLLILPSLVSLASFTSPALYFPDEMP